MEFQFYPDSDYYLFYVPLFGDFMSARTENYGSIITAFLSLDLDKLYEDLCKCEDSISDDTDNCLDDKTYCSAIQNTIHNNCEVSFLADLIYEDLTCSFKDSDVTISSTFSDKKEILLWTQHEMLFYLSNGCFQEDSTFAELITQGIQRKIEVSFSRPEYFEKDDFGIIMTYSLHDVVSMLALDWINVMSWHILIKQCENCKKFFVPEKRSDEVYCNRIYKNGKTCKELGYSTKISEDPFKAVFTKARKTQHARIRYNKHIKDYRQKHYEPWLSAASKARDYFSKKGDINSFLKWLDEHKNSF